MITSLVSWLLIRDCRYTMVMVFPVLFVGYKLFHKTRIYKPQEVDLQKDLDVIDEYERNYVSEPPK